MPFFKPQQLSRLARNMTRPNMINPNQLRNISNFSRNEFETFRSESNHHNTDKQKATTQDSAYFMSLMAYSSLTSTLITCILLKVYGIYHRENIKEIEEIGNLLKVYRINHKYSDELRQYQQNPELLPEAITSHQDNPKLTVNHSTFFTNRGTDLPEVLKQQASKDETDARQNP